MDRIVVISYDTVRVEGRAFDVEDATLTARVNQAEPFFALIMRECPVLDFNASIQNFLQNAHNIPVHKGAVGMRIIIIRGLETSIIGRGQKALPQDNIPFCQIPPHYDHGLSVKFKPPETHIRVEIAPFADLEVLCQVFRFRFGFRIPIFT